MTATPEKIAILGGGVSGITAAFAITSEPDWQQKYDITLYQLGWRIGGKGASGRNRKEYDRIEEHGIHVWFGFYYNAFKNMRACYEELNRPPGAPFATLEEAFIPHHNTAFAQYFDDKWQFWPIITPPLPGKPGEGFRPKTLFQAMATAIGWLLTHTGRVEQEQAEPQPSSKSLVRQTLKHHTFQAVDH